MAGWLAGRLAGWLAGRLAVWLLAGLLQPAGWLLDHAGQCEQEHVAHI